MKNKVKTFLILLALHVIIAPNVKSETFSGKIYTADNGSYFEMILPRIKEASESIYIIMFSARYYPDYPGSPGNIILDELVNARKRGVKVEMILNRSGRESDAALTKGNMDAGAYLAKKGLPVYFDSENKTTHVKLLVIDEKFVVMGSANWTYSALAKNNEISVIIESRKLALHYMEYFRKIKKECTFMLKTAD